MDSSTTKSVKNFEIKKLNFVAAWRWDAKCESCSICRNGLHSLCIECLSCESDQHYNKETCLIAWGGCGHVFHMHCISNWLKGQNKCPLCVKPIESENTWVLATTTSVE